MRHFDTGDIYILSFTYVGKNRDNTGVSEAPRPQLRVNISTVLILKNIVNIPR